MEGAGGTRHKESLRLASYRLTRKGESDYHQQGREGELKKQFHDPRTWIEKFRV